MKTQPRLAIDIGASGGRHILGYLEDGYIKLEEVYRFKNSTEKRYGHLCWDVEKILNDVVAGLKKCAELDAIPASVGIDTWGVDNVLLDRDGNNIEPVVAYRDDRTIGMDQKVYENVPEDELYFRTGIAKQQFNTIYQLMAMKTNAPHMLEGAAYMLLMPDYLHYRLSGKIYTEYTNATTTGLIGAESKTWDDEIIGRCGFPRGIFNEIVPAGTILGGLSDDIREAVGFSCKVILPPTHDTASAFIAVPAKSSSSVYISSGTWSLMGLELDRPITSEASRAANITNEGGYKYRYRYLKNIMGLWMLQSVQREIGAGASYPELINMARASGCDSLVDVNDNRFYAPKSMVDAIRAVCLENGMAAPQTLGDITRCICRSLAKSYAQTVQELEFLTGKRFDSINVIGGGSENAFLNEETAKACGIPVYAGPTEGTALGNILVQMLACGELADVNGAREAVRRSFDIKEFKI